jgi:hypothetical protein
MSKACGASISRLVTVIVTVAAWFSISNHCLLAELQRAPKAKASCHQPCCDTQAPAKSKTDNAGECCKTLRATLTGAAKDLVGYDSSLFALQFYSVGPVVSTADSGATTVLESDTGPPFVSTFAESVLQRSILAHAPPVIA